MMMMILMMMYDAVACITKQISTYDVSVLGVTSLNDELFVLLSREEKQIAVCSVAANYDPVRYLHLPGLTLSSTPTLSSPT